MDPLKKYVAGQVADEFGAKLNRMVTDILKTQGTDPPIINVVVHVAIECAVAVAVMANATIVDHNDGDAVNKLVKKLSVKYMTLLQREISPESWEMFRKEFPEKAADLEKLL